jgi:hydroxymethylpyrimidine pyrophosphatase-like HAD family hydrolase
LDIDIIPTKCGKGLCLNYLTNNILNLKNDFFTISFGDALTDKDMFYHSNIGVVVKNG